MSFKKYFKISSVLLFIPVIVSAFDLGSSTFKDVVTEVLDVVNISIPVLSGLAFIVFFWGLSKFILNSGSEAEVVKGKNYMFWGVLALFILITFKAIIALVATDLDIGDGTTVPQIPTGNYFSTDGHAVIPKQ